MRYLNVSMFDCITLIIDKPCEAGCKVSGKLGML